MLGLAQSERRRAINDDELAVLSRKHRCHASGGRRQSCMAGLGANANGVLEPNSADRSFDALSVIADFFLAHVRTAAA